MLNIVLPIGFLFGLAFGSFNNVLIHRLGKDESLKGRSQCLNCRKKILWYDLFPVVSFLVLKGRCRHCKKPISWFYPLVELLTAVGFGFAIFWYWTNFPDAALWFGVLNLGFLLFAIDVLIVVFFTDLIYGIIPDELSYLGIFVGVIYHLGLIVSQVLASYLSLKDSPVGKYLLPPYSNYLYQMAFRDLVHFLYTILAALAIAVIFYLLILLTKGRAMGGGDVKLGFLVGIFNGWPLAAVAIFFAFLTGAVLSVLLILLGKKRFGQTVPFGPFLAASSFITLFWGQRIFDWYIHLF